MTETPNQHLPLGIYPTDIGPFIRCSCGTRPSPHHWLAAHWPGDKAEGTRLAEEMFTREKAKVAVGEPAEEPVFTASEVKELTTKATEVALALGRKEAAAEFASLAATLHEFAANDRKRMRHEVDPWSRAVYKNRADGYGDSAEAIDRVVQEVAPKVQEATSNGLTASTGHSDLPPTSQAVKTALGWTDLPEGRDQ